LGAVPKSGIVLTDEAMHYSFTDGTSCSKLQLNFIEHPMCSRKMKKVGLLRDEGTVGNINKKWNHSLA
jgi:7-keto-8-aminopelargonate synthetase-like enzyme